MPISVGQLVTRNWPIKLAALFFAVMLYIAVAAQQPFTQSVKLRLEIDGPPGRSVRQAPGDVTVLLSGRGGELLKLRALPRVIRRAVPDTFSGTTWRLHLDPADVLLPQGADVQVADIRPRDIDISVDSAGRKDVRVVSRVTVAADSGFLVQGLSLVPSSVHLVGPVRGVAAIDSVMTVPTQLTGVSQPFFQVVPIDTATLGPVRVVPREVRVSGEVTPFLERSFTGVGVTAAASGFAGFTLATERVVVQIGGPAARVRGLTRDSLRVVAHLVGHAPPDAYARLSVAAPTGLTTQVVPDSVPLKTPPAPPVRHKSHRG
jgi:YbbR domain-containing protein